MRRITLAEQGQIIREQLEDPPAGETELHVFVRHFWPLVVPRPFVDGWHLHAKAEALEAVSRREILDLVITEPPGSMKSLFVNVFWPAWHWARIDPVSSWLFASSDQSLVNRDAGLSIAILESDLFSAAFPEFKARNLSKQPIENHVNGHLGRRYSTTPGSGGIGWHFSHHVYDDLVKPQNVRPNVPAESQHALKEAFRWVKETAAQRQIPGVELCRVAMGQRLHKKDPPGLLLDAGGWEHLCFPERYVPNASWIYGKLTARLEKRTIPGELLWPAMRDEKEDAKQKIRLGPAVYEAQKQQNPGSAEGSILKKAEIHRFTRWPDLKRCRVFSSFDLTFKKSETHARNAGILFAVDPLGTVYALRHFAAILDYKQTKTHVVSLRNDAWWNRAKRWLVEDKANGPALESDLKDDFPELTLYSPNGADKIARMLPFIDEFPTGKVQFASADLDPTSEELVDEICSIPNGTYMDLWDCLTQGLAFARTGQLSFAEARKNLLCALEEVDLD